jgi:hypothetical protein
MLITIENKIAIAMKNHITIPPSTVNTWPVT